jgi:hypothetical protein
VTALAGRGLLFMFLFVGGRARGGGDEGGGDSKICSQYILYNEKCLIAYGEGTVGSIKIDNFCVELDPGGRRFVLKGTLTWYWLLLDVILRHCTLV